MSEIQETGSNAVELSGEVGLSFAVAPYASHQFAQDYFGVRLGTAAWDSSTYEDQMKALNQATRMIDRLDFAGAKNAEAQPRQFPRGVDTDVPTAIRRAACEIALKLLDGVDIDMERESLLVTSNKVGPVGTTYNRDNAPIHILCGIPSYEAWLYLKPYLRQNYSVRVSRVN